MTLFWVDENVSKHSLKTQNCLRIQLDTNPAQKPHKEKENKYSSVNNHLLHWLKNKNKKRKAANKMSDNA